VTERKKKILSLLVSVSILFGLTGCSKSVDKNKVNDGNTNYIEGIDLNNLSNYFIVEIKNLKDENVLYYAKRERIYRRWSAIDSEFKLLKNDVVIVKEFSLHSYSSEYGEIINIVPLKQFISLYTEIKEKYTEEELNSVFESVKNDYDKLIVNDNVKKLELK